MRGVPLVIASLQASRHWGRKMVVLRGLLLPLLALVSVALTALYVVDIVRTNSVSSGCEMTYSWPMYTHLDGFKELARHRKYSLHSVHMQTVRDQLTGVPVLFVPGHMGSYKQARSLSRHLWDIDPTRYDVFAVDFKEELSGLSGQFVEDQARFVNDAVRTILKQYQKQIRKTKGSDRRKKAPESVVIVAHSMGGVVVRTAQLLPNYKRNSIQHVISLGTPFSKPVFAYDADLQNVYNRMHKDTASESSTAYLSISGGYKDVTIHASLSLTDQVAPGTHGVAVLSSKVPQIGLTVDHLCLVWCHQLLKRVASGNDAVVDRDTLDLIKDEDARLQIARSHLLGVSKGAGDDEALIELHNQSLLDGYHSAEEFTSHGTLMPQVLVRLLHLRSLSLVWMMFLIVLHIFHLQLAHWQRRFDLNAEPSSTGASAVVVTQENFPSLTTLLHPVVHAPGFVKIVIAFVDEKLSISNKSKRSTIVGGIVGVAVVIVAAVVELGRRYAAVKSLSTEVVELGALYFIAIGLLYTLVLVMTALRVLLQPLVLIALAFARRTRTKRWFIILTIYVFVQLLGHVRDFELLSLGSSPRHLALLVLSSVLVFVLHVIELGVKLENLTADQQRYRATLFALFGLSSLTWLGEVVFFFDVVRFPPSVLTNDLLGHAASVIAVLALFRYFITVTESEMVPLPPTAFFDSAEGDEENDSGVDITAENCPRCVIEDGGPGAILIEYENSSTRKFRTKLNDLVVVGPTFRVVACDCVLRFKQPREYCSFCTRSCRLCGGGSGNYAQAQKYREFLDKSKTEVALHSLAALTMELGVLALLALKKEHYVFYVMPTVVLVLALYHGLLRHPIEAQRLKKELRKREKKAAGNNNAKKKQKKKTSSAARRKAMQKTASTASTSTSSQKKTSTTTSSSSASFMEEYGA